MQNNSKPSHLSFTAQRAAGYLLGFALLYAPFELYRRFLENVLNVQPAFLPHAFCPRIPTAEIFTGGFFELNNLMLVSTLLFWLLCLLFGPFFCGRLCVAGYFAESLSHLVPERWHIEWEKYVPVPYIRFGMLLGYMLLPLWYGFYPCAYCNFYLFDSLVSILFGAAISFTVPLAATGFFIPGAVWAVYQRRARLLPLYVSAGSNAEPVFHHRQQTGHSLQNTS